MRYTLSFGGGINSAALYFLIRDRGLPLDEVIFADTGSEMPYTYEVVEVFKKLAEKDGIKFTTVRSPLSSNLYDYLWSKKTIPSRQRRDCTAKFKVRPIRNYLRATYGKDAIFTTYIGIAAEEWHRMRTSDVSYVINSYPLVDKKIDRAGCVALLEQHGITGIRKSGCYFCPFTKKAGWLDLMDNYPELYAKAEALEDNCPNPKLQLSYFRLSRIRKDRRAQKHLQDYEMTCDVAGSCFL